MSTLFGNKTTKTTSSLIDTINSLSDDALSILQHTARTLDDSELSFASLDQRGVYIEHSDTSSGFSTNGLNELVESKLVFFKKDLFFDSCFLSMNMDVFNAMVKSGNFNF